MELVEGVKREAEKLQHDCVGQYRLLKHQSLTFYSPMVVSKLLFLLKDLRLSLEKLQTLSMKDQEETAWLTLNACKLMLDIAEPLIWFNCGKYIVESLTFAAISMEAVINLCTVRHMQFRMKLYSSIFYAVIVQGSTDEAQAIWEHCQKQIFELKERELLDPPLPPASIDCIIKCAEDLAILKYILDVWRDNDSIDFSPKGTDKYIDQSKDTISAVNSSYEMDKEFYRFRILNEVLRVHHLCSGNMNETYMKRSNHIMKGIEGIIQSIDVEKLNENIVTSIYEIASLSVLDHSETPSNVYTQLKALASQLPDSNIIDGNCKERLQFLLQAHDLLSISHDNSHYLEKLSRFCAEIHRMIFIDSSYYTRSFYGKFAAAVVRRGIYEPLQRILSTLEQVGHKVLADIGAGLTLVVKGLESVFTQDSIFYGTLVTLNVNVLATVGDFRGAISVAKRGVAILEEHRAARVDFHAMQPEDVRDIMALQRQSFSTRSESSDWYHAVKRLGAHAFAGFGIFGLGSSSDRGDQALAEIHTELLALYFRTELRYGINHYLLRKTLLMKNKEIEMAKAAALKENPNMKPKGKDKEKTIKPASTTKAATPAPGVGNVVNLNASIDLSNNFTAVSVEKLPIFNTLKIYCARNSYAQCLLYIEASKLDPSVSQRHTFLEHAFSAIRTCEEQEAKLAEHFSNYTLLSHQDRLHPVVLSRSHRYIYVAPVGCRKLKNVAYYKIHAKEKGSGTEVSVYNTDLPGSERRVDVHALVNFKDSVVKIGPLRNGELYMFGSVAYSANDTIVGGVSPSSMVVEAVNPLPTVVLWSLLGQTAQALQENSLSMEASWRVCCRYFQSLPAREAFALTSGRNIFNYEEPVLCTLAIQQSTPVALHHFLVSLIRYETLFYREELFGAQTNFNYRKQEQLRYIVSFERLAAAAPIATTLQNQDVSTQLLLLCELLLDELLRYDIAHIARKLQPGLVNALLCLQRIPKRNWHDAEHRLYYKFCTALVQVGMISKNMTPIVSILNDFFLEARDKEINSLVYPSAAVLSEMESLIRYVDRVLGDSSKAALLNDAKLLMSAPMYKAKAEGLENISEFWLMPSAQRYLNLSKKSKDIANPPAAPSAGQQDIEKALLQDQAINYSDYLSVLAQLISELNLNEDYAGIVKILQRFPICKDYLAADIQSSHDDWGLSILITLEKMAELKAAAAQPVAAAAAGKKAPPPKKGAPEPEPTPVVDVNKIPDRFLSPPPEEIGLQRIRMAEIMSILAFVHEKTRGTMNHFVRSHRGILKRIVPEQDIIRNESTRPLTIANSTVGDVSAEEIVRRLGCSINLYTQAGLTESACDTLVRFWNFLTAEYVDPNQFVRTFPSLSVKINQLLSTVTELIEKIGLMPPTLSATSSLSAATSELDALKLLAEPPVDPTLYQKRDMLLLFNSILQPFLYIVKVQWLYHEHSEDTVSNCSRVFQVLLKHDPSVSLKTFCQDIWELVTEAQQTLINQAVNKLNEAKQALEKYVFDYEEAQKKKRKKKLRIARTEKDEEELLFEAEKAKLEEVVTQAQMKCEEREVEMVEVQNKNQFFQETLSKGAQMAHFAKDKLFHFISYLGRRYGSGLDWRRLLTVTASDDEFFSLFAELRRVFEKTARFLREKKERLLLVEVLDDYTSVLIRFGLFDDVQQFLNDVVDGLFNAMDACMNWKEVMHNAFQPDFDLALVPGLPYVMTALGKLSRYCAVNDYDRKAGYARMSAEIAMLMFQESIGHPVSKLGMAGYECVDLGGYNSIAPHLHHGWFQALEEQIAVLFAEQAFLEIFPLAVLGEYIASIYLRNLRLWLLMRVHRIRALTRQRLFSEAIAMYTGIRPTIEKLSKHVHGDILRQTKAVDTTDTTAYDASANDLNYYGKPSIFYNNLPPGDDKFNSKALEWIATAPEELETFLNSFTVTVPESALSPEQRQRLEAEQKAKAEAEAAAAASNKKGAKPPAKGAAAAVETAPTAAEGPQIPLFPQSQIVQMYLLSGQLLTEISTVDAHQAPKHAIIAEKWASKAVVLLQKAKEYLFTRFTDATKQPDIPEFFLRLLQQPQADTSDGGDNGTSESKTISAPSSPRALAPDDPQQQELYANFMLRAIRSDKDWLTCYRECFASEQAVFLYRRKYREILAAVTRLSKLYAHPLFQRLSSGDQQFQLMQSWFECKWFQLLALEGQANRAATIACVTEAGLPCCRAMQASHWSRTFMTQRAFAERIQHNLTAAAKDMDAVLASFSEQQLESIYLVKALVLRASLLQQEIQLLQGGDNRVCLESYHKHQKTLELLRRAADIGQRLGVQAGMFIPDTNITFQLQPLDYQYPLSETSKNESFTGAVSGYHLLNPALHALTDIHDNAPPLTITAEEAHRNLGRAYPSPWQRLRLGPVDGLTTVTPGPEEAAFLSVHPANVHCNVYLRESRVLLQAQMALLQIMDDVRCKDIHRLRHLTRSRKAKQGQNSNNNNEDDEDEKGPFDPKLLQLEEVFLVEYVLKLMRQVLYVAPTTRARAYYFTARARMTSQNPQAYMDLRAHVAPTVATASSANTDQLTPVTPMSPIMMQVQLTPIVTAMQVLTHAKTTHVWSLLKRLCLEIVRYFGQMSVVMVVEDQGVGQKQDVLRQAAQYLLLAAQISTQRGKLRQGVSELVDNAADMNTVLSNELLTQWTTQCFSSSMAPVIPSPAEIAASQAALAAAAAAAPAGKGGKAAPAPATAGKGAAATTAPAAQLTGRDAVTLLVASLREQAEFDDVGVDASDMQRWVDDAPATALALDLHVLLQQVFPASYATQCALHTTNLPTGTLLPLLAAQSAIQGASSLPSSSSTPVTLNIAAGSVSAVWDSMVATPADWVQMHSDVVTGKWFTLDAQYGCYSHAAVFVLLGDHVAIPATPAAGAAIAAPPAGKGKAPAPSAKDAANATATSLTLAADSKDPVLTRIVLYKGDIDICERRLRQLAYDMQFPRDTSAVTGATDADIQANKRFFAIPSPSYFASLVWALYMLLKQGFVGDNYWAEQVSAHYDHVASLHNLSPVIHAGGWDEQSLVFTPTTTADPAVPAATTAAPQSPRQQTLQQMQIAQKPATPLTGTIVIKRVFHAHNSLASVAAGEPATSDVVALASQPVILSLPYNVNTVKQLADIFNRTRDQAAVSQPEICNFLRLALGYSAPMVSSRPK